MVYQRKPTKVEAYQIAEATCSDSTGWPEWLLDSPFLDSPFLVNDIFAGIRNGEIEVGSYIVLECGGIRHVSQDAFEEEFELVTNACEEESNDFDPPKIVTDSMEVARFDCEMARFYEEQNGGRKPRTVGNMIEVLQGVPDDVLFKVAHDPRRHPTGIHDPLASEKELVAITPGEGQRVSPILDSFGKFFLVE